MVNGKKIIVVLPAYNAEKIPEKNYREIPFDIVDDIVPTDDSSPDYTFETTGKAGIANVILHHSNISFRYFLTNALEAETGIFRLQ